MHLSFAPLEGIGKFTYRCLQAEYFGGADTYYSPFIAPDGSGNCKKGDLRDVLPENNPGCRLIPQILCSSAAAFIPAARQLRQMGYSEINLNAGCPSGTVVSKHKGAGMLSDPRALDEFLAQVFEGLGGEISVKTRIGMSSSEEFPALLEVYNKYPLKSLIIHVRTREGMYKSAPDHAAFDHAVKNCGLPLCYNGNIFTLEDYRRLTERLPAVEHVMVGRGVLSNPALLRQLKGGAALERDELQDFHNRYLALSLSSGLSEHFALQRMKEHWSYWRCMFPGEAKLIKPIFKARCLSDYRSGVEALFARGSFDCGAGFNI